MRIIKIVAAAITVAWTGMPLEAQTLAPAVKGQELTVNGSIGAGADDDVFAESQSQVGRPLIDTSGSYGLVDLGLAYSATSRRVQFGASADSAYRVYRLDEPFTARRYAGSAGLSVGLTARLRAMASISGQESSHHIFWIFPGLTENQPGRIAPPSLDYSLTSTAGRSYDSSAALTYAVTKRSSLAAEYGYGWARYGQDAFELTRERWGGRYTHGLTRYASLRLGYFVEDAEYVERRRFRRRTIDAGIDYARPLSFSRKTALSFGAGTEALDDGQSTFYTVTGHASLTHELARRWSLTAAYNRNVGFINGFVEPFLSDSAAVGATGRLSRRVQLTASAGYSSGTIGFGGSLSPGYDTYTGVSRIQMLLGRGVAAFGEYVYYHYRFDETVVLPLNSPRSLNRRGIRGGLNYTVAIF